METNVSSMPPVFLSAVNIVIASYLAWVAIRCGKIVLLGAVYAAFALALLYVALVYVPRDHERLQAMAQQLVDAGIHGVFGSSWRIDKLVSFVVARFL